MMCMRRCCNVGYTCLQGMPSSFSHQQRHPFSTTISRSYGSGNTCGCGLERGMDVQRERACKMLTSIFSTSDRAQGSTKSMSTRPPTACKASLFVTAARAATSSRRAHAHGWAKSVRSPPTGLMTSGQPGMDPNIVAKSLLLQC